MFLLCVCPHGVSKLRESQVMVHQAHRDLLVSRVEKDFPDLRETLVFQETQEVLGVQG